MKDNRKYFFVGTRPFVLKRMLDLDLNIVCFAPIKDSFAEKELIKRNIDYISIENKTQLLELINNTDFDVLVSNGCPYILPISKLKKNDELFINIHPSLLPDLRGFNPVNGAILFDRPQGTTCHYMDDGIDTGDIICQVKVADKPDMPLDLLYQLTFMAEADVFEESYKKEFKAIGTNKDLDGTIYYSRKEEDQIINKEDSLQTIMKKVKAFQVEGQYAKIIKDKTYNVKDLVIFNAESLDNYNYKNFEIIHIYQNNVITKYDNSYLLWRLDNTDSLIVGELLI